MTPTLSRALYLAKLSLALGRVERATFHEDGVRPETDTDHAAMLALVAAELAPPHLDRAKIAAYAPVHDLIEVYSDDTQTLTITDTGLAEKAKREAHARARLLSELGAGSWVAEMLVRYEEQREPEARFVRLIDKVLPQLTHAWNGCEGARRLTDRAGFHAAKERQFARLANEYPEFVDALALLRESMDHAEECWQSPPQPKDNNHEHDPTTHSEGPATRCEAGRAGDDAAPAEPDPQQGGEAVSERIYTDRELACAHLRKRLEGSDTASLVRPEASAEEWGHILRGLHTSTSPRVVYVVKNLADDCNLTAAHTLAHYEGIGTDGGLDGWREWVKRECAAELVALASQPATAPNFTPIAPVVEAERLRDLGRREHDSTTEELERLRREVAELKLVEAERDSLLAELEEQRRAHHEERFKYLAASQDADYLAAIVGRTTCELVFRNQRGTEQVPTVHTLRDGMVYAPILGAVLYPSMNELATALAKAFGDGFAFVKARAIGDRS